MWLLDHWGGLTVSGMILTPLTDHHMMHLPPCLDVIIHDDVCEENMSKNTKL